MPVRLLNYNRPNRILLNLIFWMFYFIYPFLRFRYTGEHTVMWEEIVFYSVLYGSILYFNNLYLLPKYLENKKFREYLLILVPIVIAIAFFESYVNKTLLKTCDCEGPNSTYAIYNFIHLGSLLVMFGAVLVFRKYTTKIQALEHAETERLAAELRFLRAQVNPHMLFNSLNSIYAYAIKNSEQAPEMVLKLSEILRYMLYECEKPRVPLSKEVTYLTDYIALQEMRQTGFSVDFNVSGTIEDKSIAPMLFVAFVENAFKYSTPNVSKIKIDLNLNGNELIFCCQNDFDEDTRFNANNIEEEGLGIKNTIKLLDIGYSDKYKLDISQEDGLFNVVLKLQLDQ